MKRAILMSMVIGITFSTAYAQYDDMYFVPSKKSVEQASASYGMPRNTYYAGSNRSVDDYNRPHAEAYRLRGDSVWKYMPADSTADFQLTRNMSRWDGYTPAECYWQGYNQGRSDEWSANTWHSPWYYTTYYPWYDRWYDPWYYDRWTWNIGYWYRPWYSYPYWGGYFHTSWYYTPYAWRWGGGNLASSTYARNGNRGTISRYGNSHGSFSGSRTTSPSATSSRRSTTGILNDNRSGNFGGTRSGYTPQTGSGNFGGSRSSGTMGGSLGGGSRSGGSSGGVRMGGRR